MGIKNLKAHNKSLLLKWLWRMATEDQSLWKDIISARYGKDLGLPILLVVWVYGELLEIGGQECGVILLLMWEWEENFLWE